MAELSPHKPVLAENRSADPGDNVKTLLMTRMWISISLIIAGLIILGLGYRMLMAGATIPGNVVLNLTGTLVMMLAVVPFIYAYKALPDRRRDPVATTQHQEQRQVWRDYRSKNAG